MTKIKFTGCKHLDFLTSYHPCKRQLISVNGQTALFWLRKVVGPDMPAMVKFCKKRGRMNFPTICLSEKDKGCSDYKECTHEIDVPKEELE